jgi:serine/threonine-protein kinase
MVDEYKGDYTAAIGHYRDAIAQLPRGASDIEVDYRQRLAGVLALVDELDEAEAEARRAVALADRVLAADDVARPYAHSVLASVLQAKGKLPEALTEIQLTTQAIATIAGKRSSDYADNLRIEADILEGLGRLAEADAEFTNACEIIAFRSGEQSALEAECLMSHASVLAERDKNEDARAMTEQALEIFTTTYGEQHIQTANAHQALGLRESALGHHDQAIAHLERAVAGFTRATVDSGYLGSAEWQLAEELADRDPSRSRTLLEDSVVKLRSASAQWADILPKAEAALRRASRVARRE